MSDQTAPQKSATCQLSDLRTCEPLKADSTLLVLDLLQTYAEDLLSAMRGSMTDERKVQMEVCARDLLRFLPKEQNARRLALQDERTARDSLGERMS